MEMCPECRGSQLKLWNPGRCTELEDFRCAGYCNRCGKIFVDDRDPESVEERRNWVNVEKFGIKVPERMT